MDIYEYMEGYDREFDENEFDARLWAAMNEPDFEMDDIFEDCDIDKSRLHEWEYYFCKGLHFINMVMKKEVR